MLTGESPGGTANDAVTSVGRVTFVGTGPGDPELLTLAAVRAIEQADVLLLDSDDLRTRLDQSVVRVARGARIASLGMDTDAPAPTQARVEAIVDASADGNAVVRLVSGDPFIDGRVAAEASACAQAGLGVDVVPGVSSLTAVPGYAGVALGGANGVQFISWLTGESGPGVKWSREGSLIISTRAGHVDRLVDQAVASGRSLNEPVLITFHGGTTHQISRSGTLSTLTAMAQAQRVDPASPVHVMIGAAVQPSGNLDWFESRPLFGWRVLVPRTKDQSATLTERLRTFGAHPEEVPTISVEPPRTPQQMDKAVRGLVEGRFEWVVFTSANAVRAVLEKLTEVGLDARAFAGLRVAAVGPATAAALQKWGIVADLVPVGQQSAAGLAAEFPAYDDVLDPINRVLLPRADIATETLSAGLTALGWEVEDVTAYRTVRAAPPPAETREAIKGGKFDAVVFTSSSTVRNLVGIAGKPHAHTVIAAIGPQTAQTCREHGLTVDVMPESASGIALIDALAAFAQQRRARMIANGEPAVRPSEVRRRRSR